MNRRKVDPGTQQTLSWIQACVEAGRYFFTRHALTEHTLSEGFEPADAKAAILAGEIIEDYEDEIEDRCLICGAVSGLELTAEFVSTYIHCVVRYDRVDQIIVVTMYRPRSSDWINQFTRRPDT